MTRVGFEQIDISCAPGTALGGNAREDKASRGVHDPLHATIVVLVPEGAHGADSAHVVVGLDLLAAPAALVDSIATAICRRTGISATSVAVSATHTHSGPDTARGSGFDDHDYTLVDAWQSEAVPAIAEAAAVALGKVVPAALLLASSEVTGLSFNRRLVHRDGSTRMNWETLDPDDIVGERGPIDPELLVLVFTDDAGAALGAIVHFTLHPAILVGHDWLVSSDFVAETSALLVGALGGAPVLFVNGALGNINHLNYREPGRAIGFEESARVGTALGEAATRALAGPRASVDIVDIDDIDWRSTRVTLEQRTIGRARLEHAEAVLAANAGKPVEALDGIPEAAYAHWAIVAGRALTPLLDVDVGILRFGRVVLVYVPFEVFVEFGLALRRAFPDHIVRVVSLGGGYFGYLPTAAAFAEGGYEPTFGTSTIESGQGEYLFRRITTEVRDMLRPATADEGHSQGGTVE